MTLVDRKICHLLCGKWSDKNTKKTSVIYDLLRHVPCQSLTLDNGRQLVWFSRINGEPDIPVYFALPYSSWRRGTNENINKLLSQFVLKSLSFTNVTCQEFRRYICLLNNKPKKCLGFVTTAEVFLKDKCRT